MYAIIEKLAEGSGGPSPRCGDKAVVHYSGWLANKPNDAPFDSSREKGHAFTFAVGVGKVLPGWDEAVQAMVKGARWRIHIPCEHAYGPRGRPPKIPPAADRAPAACERAPISSVASEEDRMTVTHSAGAATCCAQSFSTLSC